MFKEELTTDVEGLLNLYETAYVGVRGESVLDEALLFSTNHLKAFLKQGHSILSDMVSKALYRPLRKSLVRVNAAHFISTYKDIPSYNEILLRFAVLDFNLVQSKHQKELCDLTKWWKNMGFGKRFPFARDRIVESFFWATGVCFEPEVYFFRKMSAKFTNFLAIIDDIYDSYGTLEELSLFTQKTKRWGRESTDDLPEYMKILYTALLDFFEELEEHMMKQGTSYRMLYVKEELSVAIQSYFDEAQWRNEKIIPTVEEYLSVSATTSCYVVISTVGFACMAVDAVTEEDFHWVSSRPKILKASELVSRLMDDIVSAEREKESGDVVKAIECYVTQHGTTVEEAIQVLTQWVSEAWKDINQELLEPTYIKRDILLRILHITQVTDELYKEEDSYTVVGTAVKEGISALFINPVSF